MKTTQPQTYAYQVGGSLAPHAPCYVERKADEQLLRALSGGEFCYVLNSRQMGKSSLRVRATNRLQALGIQCGVIDLTEIGTHNLTPDQWYASLAQCLVHSFNLTVELGDWWRQRLYLSPVKRLGDFVEQVLLTQVHDDIVLFIDEIDSVLSLDFSSEDFFALIRAWYNRRTESAAHRRLTLALFGVATPSELISDHQRTPFNVGKAIALEGFQQHEALPLLPGLATVCSNPEAIMSKILSWTGGHPFLSQKLCQLVLKDAENWSIERERITAQSLNPRDPSAVMNEKIPTTPQSLSPDYIDQLVQKNILTNWESQDEPEHLKSIRDYLLSNEYHARRLLGLYQSILKGGSVALDNSPEQMNLLLSGLVVKANGALTLRNRIYATIFNPTWVSQQLDKLRPYANAFMAWLQSDCRDESRLLRGQALQEALVWSSLHSLSHEDYQFLAASQMLEQQQVQQQLKADRAQAIEAQLAAETERAQEAEARLAAETESTRRQRWLLIAASLGIVVASTLGGTTFLQYRRAVKIQHQAKQNEVNAIATSAEALLASDQSLDATIEAIRAMGQLKELAHTNSALEFKVGQVLRAAIFNGAERNRLSGHTTGVNDIAIHPDSQLIASASADSTIKLWKRNGTLVRTLTGHQHIVLSVDFSPDGQLIASGSYDKTVRLWALDGTPVGILDGHNDDVTSVAFSPDGQRIASASVDTTIKVWNIDGTLIHTIKGHDQPVKRVTFSPDGRYLVSADDKTVKLWRSDGSFVRSVEENWLAIQGVAFSPDGKIIASSSPDNIKLWSLDGNLLKTLEGGGQYVTFSPDGQRIAAVSDTAIQFWTVEGTPLSKLYIHRNHGAGRIVFSPDGQFLASISRDRTVKLWQIKDNLLTFLGHKFHTHEVTFSPDGKQIATAGWDHTARLWQTSGEQLQLFKGHRGEASYQSRVNGVSFSPDGQMIASSGADATIKLWQLDGTLLQTLDTGNPNSQVYATTFSPDGQLLLSVAWGGPIQLWNIAGTLVRTLEESDKNVGRGAFSPDGQLIAAPIGIDNVIHLWRRDGTLLKTFKGHTDWIGQVVFSPDGQYLLSTGADQTIKIWSLDGTLLRSIDAHADAIKALAISPDGQLIASGGRDEIVKLWTWDGTLVATFPQPSMVWGIAFHPDGNQLAWTGMNRVTLLKDLDLALNSDRLLSYGCNWVQDYLRTSPEVDKTLHQLCQDLD